MRDVAHRFKGCHYIWLNIPFICEWEMRHISRMRCVTHTNEGCHTYEWNMSHIWMRDVAHMNETCHTYEWVMSHIWMSHVTHMNERCNTYEWNMSHICMKYVTHMNEICHKYEWDISQIYSHSNKICHTYEWVECSWWHVSRMRYVTHMNAICNTYEWDMSHIWMSHVTHMNESNFSWRVMMRIGRRLLWRDVRGRACPTYEWVVSHSRTKSFLEPSGYRTCPLKTSGYRPRLTQMGGNWKVVYFEFMSQIKQKSVYGAENPHPK